MFYKINWVSLIFIFISIALALLLLDISGVISKNYLMPKVFILVPIIYAFEVKLSVGIMVFILSGILEDVFFNYKPGVGFLSLTITASFFIILQNIFRFKKWFHRLVAVVLIITFALFTKDILQNGLNMEVLYYLNLKQMTLSVLISLLFYPLLSYILLQKWLGCAYKINKDY